jgi:hypothetical protein
MNNTLNEINSKLVLVGNDLLKSLNLKTVSLSSFSLNPPYDGLWTTELDKSECHFYILNDKLTLLLNGWGDWFYENDDEFLSIDDSSMDIFSNLVNDLKKRHPELNIIISTGNELIGIVVEK